MKLGDISVRFIELMLRTLPVDCPGRSDILRRADISAELLSSPEARISIPRFMKLGHAFIQATGNPALGLDMGRNLQISHFGFPGFAVMTAPRLDTALALCVHFEKLASENRRGSSRFYGEAGSGVAEFYSISPYNAYNWFVVDCILSGWQTLAEWLTGETGLLARVEIEFPRPAYGDLYAQRFRCPVRFGQPRNALILKPAALTLPVLYAQSASHQASLALCNEALLAVRRGLPLEHKVRQRLMSQPQLTAASLENLSEQLGMTPWTLKRNLAKRGTSVSELAEEVRRDMARTYLTTTSLKPSEIAFELGYRSQPSFFRAFRRWYGTTPEAFRASWCDDHNSTPSSTESSSSNSASQDSNSSSI